MDNKVQEYIEKCGNFHTQANLAQAILDIMVQHYSSLRNDTVMPSFIKMGLSNISNNIACIVNGNTYSTESWEAIQTQAELVLDLVKKAQAQTEQKTDNGEENNENT